MFPWGMVSEKKKRESPMGQKNRSFNNGRLERTGTMGVDGRKIGWGRKPNTRNLGAGKGNQKKKKTSKGGNSFRAIATQAIKTSNK